MADAIVDALNKNYVQTFDFLYEGETVDVLWTGEDLIRLEIRDDYPLDADIAHMTAEQIARAFYRAVPRTVAGDISVIDRDRIAIIEAALSHYAEIFFMCQPTCEGECLVQAMKMYFNIEEPNKNIVLELFSRVELNGAVLHGFHSKKLNEHRSDKYLREIVARDMQECVPFCINGVAIGILELKLLHAIGNLITQDTTANRAPFSMTEGRKRKTWIGGLLDIEILFVSMSAKYDMDIYSLWDGLLYLYAKGLISNPMTHIQSGPDFDVVVGWGTPERPSWEDVCDNEPRSFAGIYTLSVDNSLIGIPFDGEDTCSEHFIPKVSAIYSYIVEEQERVKAGQGLEEIHFPAVEENDAVHLSCLMSKFIKRGIEFKTDSIENSFGALIYRLVLTGLIDISNGLVKLTDRGKIFLKRPFDNN